VTSETQPADAAVPPPPPAAPARLFAGAIGRPALVALGGACVVLGLIGVVVPGMPTTIFLIIALWAFARSSDRFHAWLWNHPRLGPPLRAWHHHRVVPLRAKLAAVLMMAASWLIVVLWVAESWIGPALLAAVLLPVALYIVSKPSRLPAGIERETS